MADKIDYEIIGHDMQLVEIELDPGEGVRAEAGTMLYMNKDIEMQTTTGGGIWKGFKRMFTGSGFFITTFLNTSKSKEKAAFAAPYPGTVIQIDLKKKGGEFICQKDAFLCAEKTTEIDIAFTKRLGAGFFGGEGFILQKLTGDGQAFIHAGGTVIKKTLKKGETLKVDTGCIVGFTPEVDYDIKLVGGFRNTLFGGEGLFLANLTGPGEIYLQSLPFSRLADRISAASSYRRNTGENRGIIGSLTGGDNNI